MAEDLNLIVNEEDPIEFEINERSPIDLKISSTLLVEAVSPKVEMTVVSEETSETESGPESEPVQE